MIFNNSRENNPFYKYLNFINNKQKQVELLKENEKILKKKFIMKGGF